MQQNAKWVATLVVGVILLGIVGYLYWIQQSSRPEKSTSSLSETETPTQTIPTSSAQDVLIQDQTDASRTSAQQVDFVDEQTTFSLAETGPTVIFFKASWCPTCQAAQRDINANFVDLPEGLVIVTADYDTETALQDRYGITYQHTWVQVNSTGDEIAKWNGGGVAELNQNIIR